MRRFFRTTYGVAITVLFLVVAVLGFTQTKIFRPYLRGRLVETVASQLHAELTLGTLEGNFLTGFHVEDVTLRRGGETVLTVKRLEAKYDPLGTLTKSASVSRLTLVNPVICLTRSSKGLWNIGQLFKSSSTDTSASAWTITLKQIRIESGQLRIVDSLDLSRRSADSSLRIMPGRIDYSNLQLDSLNLDAAVSVSSHRLGLTVRSLACSLAQPQLEVKQLAGEFLLAPTSTSVRNFNLVTGKSRIRLNARMDSIDVTKISDIAQLQHVPVSARLRVEQLDFGELKQFIGRPVSFLEREVNGQVDVEGQFGSLEVRNVTLQAGSTLVRIAGTLMNLHHPRDLELDLAGVGNKVDPAEIRHLMPSLGIPDLSSLGLVEYDLHFVGKPASFNARLASSSRIGRVDVDGNLDFQGTSMSYDGTIRTARLNLAPLLGDSALASSLKSTITVQGRGTRFSDLTCIARAEFDSSQFYGLPLSRSVVVVDVADRTIRPRLSLHLGSTRVDLGGTLQVQPQDLVKYDVTGRINSFNLADVTKKKEHESDISFDVQARGQFKSFSSFAGDMSLNFFRSSFDTVTFAGGPATVHVNTLDAQPRKLQIESDAFDLDVQGRFTPAGMVTTLARGATLIGEAVRYRVNALDSLRAVNVSQRDGREFHSSVAAKHDSTDYRFTLNVKDSYPIGVILGRTVEGTFTATGDVREGDLGIHLGSEADVRELRYADKSISFGMENGTIAFSADGLSPSNLLESIGLNVGVRAGRFDIEDLQTANLDLAATMYGDSSRYTVAAMLDSTLTVNASGAGSFRDRLVSMRLGLLSVDFNSYEFRNREPVELKVGRDGFLVSNMLMSHNDEEISASGYFDPVGVSDLVVSAHNVLMNTLPKAVRRTKSLESLPTMSGTVSANATFEGSLDEPRFTLDLNATGVRYEERTFGTVQIRSSYADRLLSIFAQLHSRPDSTSLPPELLVNGTVPYDLSLKARAEEKLEGEMNLDVQSTDFHLEFLDPFIPELSNLSGLLICNMKLRGTVESPSYEGSVTIQNARFLFNPLGIQYLLDGKLVPNGRKIEFQGVTVRNIPADRPDGKLNLSGSFTLEGLKIKDFDLEANGQLLVMKESARRANQGLYGDLFAGIGSLGLTWQGSPSRSYVSGDVEVKYSNLTLPAMRQTQELPNSRIDIRVIDDKAREARAVVAGEEHPGNPPRNLSTPARSTQSLALVQVSPVAVSKSFLDNIAYNLSIETQGPTQLRFIFSNFTNEQLLAELKGRTVFTKDGDQTRLTGELDLGNRSYYNNFKKLDATGKVRFTGDPLNPELDIVATYEGVHRDTSGTSRISGSSVKVVVKVFITGTKDQPKVKMGLSEYDQLGNLIRQDRPDVEGDAIAFLVTGSFRDELTQQDKLSLAGSNVIGGVASSILSGPLTDLLRKEFGIVRSVDVLYYGGGTLQESADLRLTGEVGDAVFRLGGRVLSDLNNTNISIQVPMSSIVGSEKWRNLLLEAERTVQGVETIDQRRESRGIRLLYRIIF